MTNISARFPLPPFLRRLPFWLGVILIAFVPIRILATIDYLVSGSGMIGNFFDASLVLSLLIIYFLYAVRFISVRMERLSRYASQIGPENTTLRLGATYHMSPVLVIWLILLGTNTILFPVAGGLTGVFAENIPVYAYFFLILALLLYVYGFSMLTIYKAGKLPLQLKPFTEDRTLGLRPFGTTSLTLATVYAVFPIIITIVQLVTINVEVPGGVTVSATELRPSDIIFIAALVLIGVALFFLPLLSIHRRLVEAKRLELGWITPWYTRIVQALKSQTSVSVPEGETGERSDLAGELTMVYQLQSPIHRIQTWPFDIGVITRLASVLVLPPVLGVVARILILIFLRI